MSQVDGTRKSRSKAARAVPCPSEFLQICMRDNEIMSIIPANSEVIALSSDLSLALKKALARTPDSHIVLTILRHIGDLNTKSITFEAERGTVRIFKKLGD